MWPSVLAAGPHGWVADVVFAVCGVAVILFAAALAPSVPTRPARAGAACVALAGAALALLAFPTDLRPQVETTWHGTIHDAAWPVVPLAAIAAAGLFAVGLRGRSDWGPVAAASALAAPLFALGFAATAVHPVEQLLRFVLFGLLLAWFELLALGALTGPGSPSGGRRSRTRHTPGRCR